MIRGFRFGVFAFIALVALVGCGGGGAPQSNTPPNTLYVALEAEPPELDPNLSSAYVDRQVMASLYDKLVDIDENGEIVPMLAKTTERSTLSICGMASSSTTARSSTPRP
jgi:ABC-type oligopeptide transport system substrate-binding subunit